MKSFILPNDIEYDLDFDKTFKSLRKARDLVVGAGREPLLWAVPAAAGGPSGFFRGAEGR